MSGISKQAKKVLHPDIIGTVGKTGGKIATRGRYNMQRIVSNSINKKVSIQSVLEADESLRLPEQNVEDISLGGI